MQSLKALSQARRSLPALRFLNHQRSISASPSAAQHDDLQNQVLVEGKASARAAVLNRPSALNALTTNMLKNLVRHKEAANYFSKDVFSAVSGRKPGDLQQNVRVRFLFTGMIKDLRSTKGNSFLFWERNSKCCLLPHSVRTLSSDRSQSTQQTTDEGKRKDISTIEDPFDAPTYHIPEKPVTFVEGASYSVIILAGLGVAGLAAYAVFKELIFEPKEYKIFGKALERVQHDNQVTVRIGSPVTGYGSESRNRAARQRIPHRVWTDENGVEHVEVNFFIRGPHGAGKVFAEMFKDNADRKWKYTSLIVEITSPTRAQLLLESYVPA